MIVHSMTFTEIQNELYNDLPTLKNKILYCQKEFKRRVLKASRYPFAYSYDCYTRIKKNHFILTFTAMKRSGKKNPLVGVYGLYTRAEGVYAVALAIEEEFITIFSPHFFKRYRERIAKDFLASAGDLIKRYFATHRGFSYAVLSEDMKAVYRSLENKIDDGSDCFVCVTTAGYCFGERQGNIYIMKTIVSEDMLFENQKETFSDLREKFIRTNKELYGI
ncbi:hypothetical protein [Pedobacter roseus]|uniref:Uncharacterized protein n=1 Tax=Pedobacter roseus TaxID=336820 RepID=A0A7G9QGB1_9SPHI|nr:hypothetical protein [Pedobacter roseus]QNN42386.1 hypothetical protein H9L23_25480 [Pedobacter roseus]